MLTFKRFLLLEGGKAMAAHNVKRATKEDIEVVLQKLSDITGLPVEELSTYLLGSTTLTIGGKQNDSGDIDIAFPQDERETIVKKVEDELGVEGYKIGQNTLSYPFEANGKNVQVDLMFVPDLKWALFSHYADDDGHKSGVRNELIHSVLRFAHEPGKDLRIQDPATGDDVVRASRSYKLDTGVERIFKVAKMRKDGKGRVKGAEKATPEEVQAALDELGNSETFSPDPEVIRDPDEFAQLLFGPNVKAEDMLGTKDMIALIKRKKPKEATEIFKHAVKGMKARGFEVPNELKQYA